VIAHKMGFDAVSVSLSLDNITATVRRAGEWATRMREIGPPGINAWRITELEQLAKAPGPGLAPREIAAKLSQIDSTMPRYSSLQIVVAVGVASSGFAFLNGAAVPEMIAAAIGGGVGQWVRLWLSRRQVNHYGVAALSAVVASGMYVLAAVLARYVGFGFAHYPAGFIASVLFLVPGFPLIAALFDSLQYQTVAAVSRLVYGVMILLAVAFGPASLSRSLESTWRGSRHLNSHIPPSWRFGPPQVLSQAAPSQCCSIALHVQYWRWVFWRWQRMACAWS
jgi:uncharacterized membrane protein YjjP (DUF1212 family)